jgi:hypothetical protein
MGELPFAYRDQYITPTLLFYLEIAKLGHLNKLNAKEVNEILSNNKGYIKEVFDMFNYLMLVMFAIEQQRDKEHNRKHGTKSPELLAREMFGDVIGSVRSGKGNNKDDNIVTIEVTPEDMKKMQESRHRNSQENMRREREEQARKLKEKTGSSNRYKK